MSKKIKNIIPDLITAIAVFLLSFVHPLYSFVALIALLSIWLHDNAD